MTTKIFNQSATRGMVSQDLQAQRDYLKRLDTEGVDYSLVVGEAFVRSIRDLGYKNTGAAIDELIDNALQAEATKADVVFGFPSHSDNKPDKLAVIDDGHGMDADMIRRAVMWGGGHRFGSNGLGKYGFGLPSAAVSQGRSFTVYSKPADGKLYSVTIDLDDLPKYIVNGNIKVPDAQPADVPRWLGEVLAERYPRFADDSGHGTIVIVEKLDKLRWKTAENLKHNLLEHFGLVYRNFLGRALSLRVDETPVQAIDPLFLTEGFRFYDIDADRAQPLPPGEFAVKAEDSRGTLGKVRVRYSYMPLTFGAKDKTRQATEKNRNPRFDIMKQNKGIIICREGRQIDVVERVPAGKWSRVTTFTNYDWYWGVEVDFDSALDEEFGVTTAKQQITLSDRMWDLLEREGVKSNILTLRKKVRKDQGKLESDQDNPSPDQPRPSEKAMAEAERFKHTLSVLPEQLKKAQANFQQAVENKAREENISLSEAEERILAEINAKKYNVRTENVAGAPFYRPERLGSQIVLWLNQDHRFYTQVYARPDVTPATRAALEVTLFSIVECELGAVNEEQVQFYNMMRRAWSENLDDALSQLEQIHSVDDRIDAKVGEFDDAEEVEEAPVAN